MISFYKTLLRHLTIVSDNDEKKLFEEILEIETYDLLNAISGKTSYNDKYKDIINQLSNLSILSNGKSKIRLRY